MDNPPRRRKRRRGWLIGVLALVVLLGAGMVGVALLKPDLLRPVSATPSPSAVPEKTPAPVLVAATDGTAASMLSLQALIEPLIANSVLGRSVRVSVVDLRTGNPIYQRDASNMVVPASNAKVVTAAAVLATLGPAHRITTRAVAGANPGEVVLIGAGDATLAVGDKGFYAGAARLDDLAEQVKKALGATVPTKLIVDGSLFQGGVLGPEWDPDAPDEGYVAPITALMTDGGRVDHTKQKQQCGGLRCHDRHDDPEMAAAQAFAGLLGVTEIAKGAAPAGATELGAVKSAPMIRLLESVLGDSDNTVAESLARQVAVAKNKPATFEGAAEAIEAVLTELGMPGGQFDMADGSGYSRRNQLSPAVLTGLLTKAVSDARLADLFNVLPVAGWSGSMGQRFGESDATAGLGVVRAKSGTLSKVNSITGVVQTAGGGLIGFSILAENVPTWQEPAQDALDRIVAKIASCGCS
ncbi:D-alanyl-D-alanine carboxypeptidase/D-alanyl-D-alanine endopeptidase [Allorhizocola rhizosphaerae]|uniref:D-alanyl-D-alanine carboxypeptidase/D-alanyl-D-alanine endopeptidase n=1 Tax=Allorhizocola rhizosphaerae TaxID=1872709 RepID=UPI001FE4EF67|nr:D-alanyl-D-alanine carboxypeptidase/D-alanyl-D-alanine-endopeptidase [Allorhizocola rhizosphaerae]